MAKAGALAKFLKKHGKSIDDFKESAGAAGEAALKVGKGAASEVKKRVGDFAKKNPVKSSLGAGGTGAFLGASLGSGDDDDDKKRKRKKPAYLD